MCFIVNVCMQVNKSSLLAMYEVTCMFYTDLFQDIVLFVLLKE